MLARLLLCCLLLAVRPVCAHDPFESTTIVRLTAEALELETTMSRATALAAAAPPGAPFATFEPAQLDAVRPQLLAAAPGLFAVTVAGTALTPRAVDVGLDPENDVTFRVVYPRPECGPLGLAARHVAHLGYGYGSTLSFQFPGGSPEMKLLMGDDLRHEVELPVAGDTPTAESPRLRTGAMFTAFLRLGVAHIITGYDHLLFLLGLLVVCRRAGGMVGVVTCFTLAHSLTLALAALDVFALPGRLVEPLIAASIVYVGVENLVCRDEPRGRWLLTFVFGLVHGFGFAGVLRDLGLGANGGGIALPLFSFNLGVELGQLAVAAVVLPLLLALRRRPGFVRRGPPLLSGLIASAGAWWLLQRLLFV